MKRILLIALACVGIFCSAPGGAIAQTYKVQNLDVLGTSTLTGLASFTVRPQFNGATPWDSANLTLPLSIAQGGTGSTTAGGALTALGAQPALGFTPVQQGGGAGQGTNKIFIGWSGTKLKAQVDVTDEGNIALENSPSLTGVPTSPTAAAGTNSTQISTTGFVWQSLACPNIMGFGGDPTNTNDNSAAFASAAAASPSGRACVSFPPGKFKFTSQLGYTLPTSGASITIIGAGADVTELTWPNASGGIVISYSSPGNSAHFRDMTISTGQASGGNGIGLLQTSCLADFAQNDIHRVTFRGADNNAGTGGVDYWTNAYLIDGVSGTSVDTVTVYGQFAGNGGVYQGNGTCYSIYHNITKSTFNNLTNGIEYLSYAQGITVTQTNIQNTATGFWVPASQTGILSQLQISDSQFATSGNGILIQTTVGGIMLHGNDMFCHLNTSCIDLAAGVAAGYSIIGNNISTDGTGAAIGINVDTPLNASQVGTIVGNAFAGLNICVNLTATSKGNNVQANAYAGCTTNVNNAGGANNSVGVATP